MCIRNLCLILHCVQYSLILHIAQEDSPCGNLGSLALEIPHDILLYSKRQEQQPLVATVAVFALQPHSLGGHSHSIRLS